MTQKNGAEPQLLGVTLCRVDLFVDAPMFVGWIHADEKPSELREAMLLASKFERKLGQPGGFLIAVRVRVVEHRLTRVVSDVLTLETLRPEELLCLWSVGVKRVDVSLPNVRVAMPFPPAKQRGRKPKSSRRVRLLDKVGS